MAMLAEPRRKQKWTLNPRGKHWSEDSNKFGQKMLEKMGWTSGKGLGAKEQGMTEHVRVKFKDDSSGIGYSKDDHDKEWTHHQEGFNDLLMNLQKSQNMEPTELMESKEIALSGMSLEQKSKQSKARVHYQKFTRGKDVNKYSAKDLANIFGKKTLEEKPKIEENVEEEFSAEPIGSKDNTGGVVTIKGGNIHDYFRTKMSATMKKSAENESKENTDSEEERYVGFGFSTAKSTQEDNFSQSVVDPTNYGFENPCVDSKNTSIVKASPFAKPSPIAKPPRKRKNVSALSNGSVDPNYSDKNDTPKKIKPGLEVDCFVNPALNLEFPVDETRNGAEFEVSRSCGLLNPALDISEDTPKKKLKKEKNGTPKLIKTELEIGDPDCFVNPALNLELPVDETRNGAEFEVSRPRGFLNPALDVSEDTPRKKRRKEKNGTPKQIKTELEVGDPDCFVNPALNLECPVDETRNGSEFEVSRPCGLLTPALDSSEDTPKKKRKKDKIGTPKKIKTELEVGDPDCFVNPALNLEYPVNETRNGTEFEVSRPCGFLNPALDLSEGTPKKKQKKEKIRTPKKIKTELDADCFVNPALNLECPIDETRNGSEFEVSRNSIPNPTLDLSEETPKKIKKRKKVSPSTEGFVNSALNVDCPVDERENGTVFEVSRVQMGLANEALDLSDEASGKKRVTFNDLVEYKIDGVKKKKGKTKLDKFEVENQKLKRKKKHVAAEEKGTVFVNEALDVEATSEEIQDNELNERKCRKEKRKKNRRMSNLETIEEAPEEEKEVSDEIIRELEVITVHGVPMRESDDNLEAETRKKSRKKKKKEKSQEDLDTIEICETDKDVSLTEATGTSEIKKKRQNGVKDKFSGFDKENSFTNEETVPETEKIIKKKKKRKSMETCKFFLNEDIAIKDEPETEENSEEPRESKKNKKRSRNSDVTEENEDLEDKQVENSEDCSTPSKKRRLAESTSEVPQSPYEKMAKKSKSVLKAMFAKSPVVHFKGSNINEIKGYGVDP